MPEQTAALVAKEKGNAAFKAGDFPGAIGHYTAAILADPKEPTFPLNRAAAYLKLGKSDDAERDCTLVLSLDPKNTKALFRRAQAASGAGSHERAVGDLERALKLEPANASVKDELKRVKALVSAPKPTPRTKPAEVPIAPLAGASATAPRRRRVPITIVEPPASEASSASSATPKRSGEPLLTPVSSRPLGAAPAVASAPSPPGPAPAPSAPASFQDAKKARDSARPSAVGGGIFRSSGQHTLVRGSGAVRPAPVPAPAAAPAAPAAAADAGASSNAPKGAAVLLPRHAMPTATKAPMSAYMFARSWDSLREPDKRWKLLTQIPPASLPDLFQTALEAQMLAALIRTLAVVLEATAGAPPGDADAAALRGWVRAYMAGLARVPRFGTIALFLSGDEKAAAKKILAALQDAGEGVDGWSVL